MFSQCSGFDVPNRFGAISLRTVHPRAFLCEGSRQMPVSAVFVVHLRRQPTKTAGPKERGRTQSEGGWQGASESAVSAKLGLVLCLARNRRRPKRPSEPRPSGAHPEEDVVGRRRGAYLGWLLGIESGPSLLPPCPATLLAIQQTTSVPSSFWITDRAVEGTTQKKRRPFKTRLKFAFVSPASAMGRLQSLLRLNHGMVANISAADPENDVLGNVSGVIANAF